LTDVLLLNLDEKYLDNYLEIINNLRSNWINAEFYLETSKIAKQIKYAENKGIKLVIILWEDEINKWVIAIKDLDKKEQTEVQTADLIKKITYLIW
jgi:histidyl-tRNA synthetase